MPVTKKPGHEVYAATINQGGALVVAVTREAGETMLARIIRMVEEAQEQRRRAEESSRKALTAVRDLLISPSISHWPKPRSAPPTIVRLPSIPPPPTARDSN